MLILLRLKFSARVGNFINLYRFLLIYLSNNFLILKDPSVSYHVFFKNMTQVNGYKGFVGYSIRELSSNEINQDCQTKLNSIDLHWFKLNFTSDFMIRTYSSGCYSYDVYSGKWSSNGMDVYEDTNLTQTHCISNVLK